MELPLQKTIENKILENYIDYQCLFMEFQSKFLSSLYSRYENLENGNLVLYYAKQAHRDILRLKDYDLNFNISYEKFWENNSKINHKQKSIIKIARDTLLPKETTRRKILQLVKKEILNKENRNIKWLPSEQYKQRYNIIIDNEINEVCKLIDFVCQKTNFTISKEEVIKSIKEKFSFYWFHFLEAQLEYLKLWNKQIKDLELVIILLQVAHVFTAQAKEKNLSHRDLFNDPNLFTKFAGAGISATSIYEITRIPRATCVRKLKTLVKLKMILQDKSTRRYYVIPEATLNDLISQKITTKVVQLFSNFFFICLRGISTKT